MKKLLAILLVLTMVLAAAGCRSAAPATTEPAPTETPAATEDAATEAPATEAPAATGDYKIGIVTGTVSQGEEEFQAAQKMVAKYGDKIVTATYPDKFNEETETTISNIASLASDPAVKAIIVCQAVPGTSAAIDKVRETRPDMLFIAGVVAEAPDVISKKADFIMQIDEVGMGTAVPTQAAAQGAKTFIHYSFARHLSYETIAVRRELFMKTCEELGIEFVDVTAPDPTSDAGVAGAQQFIKEDVPRQLEKYGKDTAFFSTNCAMMEPLISTVAAGGGIFPQQCCPSPYHGYPAAFGIDVTGHEGDVDYMLEQTKAKVAEAGNAGRMSTWPVPVNMIMIEAATEYSIKFCEGEITERADMAAFESEVNKIADCQISIYESADGPIDNYYMILSDFYNF